VQSFVEKYPKIKYAIPDGRQLDICETSFITEWIVLKLKILTDIKIRFKKKQTFTIGPVVCSGYPNMCDRTRKIGSSASDCDILCSDPG
jgi:hypothetical protein